MTDFRSRRQRSGSAVRQPKKSISKSVYTRSRTITGSISSKVSSAVESASQLKSARLEAHELHGYRRKVIWLLVGALLVSGLLAYLIDNTILRLVPASALDERYVATVNQYYDRNFLERLPWSKHSPNLLHQVQQSHPEVASLSLSGDSQLASHSLSVELRQPVAQWVLGDETYYVDKNGIAYMITDPDIRPIELIQIKDETGLPIASQRVASKSMMQFIGQVVAGINSSGVGSVEEIIIPAGTLKQVDLILKDRPYRIKAHIDRSPSGQVSDIISSLRYLDQQVITPEYVDVRVVGKAFYR